MGCWFMKALYSNFDHRFIKASYDLIIKTETNEEFEHCAWNFYGKIGKINNKFSETIMQNGIVVARDIPRGKRAVVIIFPLAEFAHVHLMT